MAEITKKSLPGQSILEVQWVYWVVRQSISKHWSSFFVYMKGLNIELKKPTLLFIHFCIN